MSENTDCDLLYESPRLRIVVNEKSGNLTMWAADYPWEPMRPVATASSNGDHIVKTLVLELITRVEHCDRCHIEIPD